jgi:serine protease AprX
MATPVVTGAAAMLIAHTPAITPDELKAKLIRNAWRGFPSTMPVTVTEPTSLITTTYTQYGDIFTIGAGQVDIWAADNDTTTTTGSAASPARCSTPPPGRCSYN